ncbi:MAG: DNA-binding protein [Chloroflexi bacterium]|nr:DNA-binding protein [Chloroflexota bacterium]
MPRKNNRSDPSLEKSRRVAPATIQIAAVAGPVFSLGDSGILKGKKLAFFCSVKCPGEPIVQAYDFARAMRDAGVTVISGFQSPIEKDCLELLLRGNQPVVICPARSLHRMRLPAIWKTALKQERLLLLSPFAEQFRRPTVELSEKRNEFVATLADQVIFAYAEPGGKTEGLAKRVMSGGKPVFTLDSKENANLVALGARAVKAEEVVVG